MVMTHFGPDGEVEFETKTRTIIDFERRRLSINMFTNGEWQLKIVYIDGEAMSISPFSDTPAPLPAEQQELFTQLFDLPAFAETLMPEAYDIVSYDGHQSYAGALAGEQVTVIVPSLIGALEDMKMRMLFDEEGALVATIVEDLGPLPLLTVVDEPVEVDGVPVGYNFTSYRLEGGRLTLEGQTRIAYVAVDQELSDELFALEPSELDESEP